MLYIYGCNSSVGQYTSTSKNAVLELHGSSPKNCTFDIQFITINSSGVLTLMITDGTLKNSGGVSDGSQYSTPFSAYLTNAVWELSNRGQMCFIGAQAGWSIDIRRSCFKTYGSEIYNCSSNAYLQTLTYQYDQYWNGECMQYCMSGGGYEDDCISGTQYINTYYSFPY